MALGGGTFTAQDKILPGTFINFASKIQASIPYERGIVAVAMDLNWGKDNEIMEIEQDDFQKNSKALLGYDYTSEELKLLREMFLNAKKVYLYRLNKSGVKASNEYAEALYAGTRGNDITISISANVDEADKFDVVTLLNNKIVDKQIVESVGDLKSNDYVSFKDTELTVNAGIPLSGGTNGTVGTIGEHQSFLDKIESYSFNVLACNSNSEDIKQLYVEFTKRMRDEVGSKFQTVIHKITNVDYEGVIVVENICLAGNTHNLVFFTAGITSACQINSSATNATYTGELDIDTNYTQTQLEQLIEAGKFVYHKVGSDIRILKDINSFVVVTDDKNDMFKNNKTIRIIDELALDITILFDNKYLGKVPNNADGRASLWSDIISLLNRYVNKGAISSYNAEEVTIEKGNSDVSVLINVPIVITGTMEQLYMTVIMAKEA